MSKAAERILKAASEALAFAEGKTEIAHYGVHAFSAPDIGGDRQASRQTASHALPRRNLGTAREAVVSI